MIEANRYREKTWEEKLKEVEALENILKLKAKEKQVQGGKEKVCQNSDKALDVKKEVSKSLSTSHDTLHKAKTIAKEKPELIKQIDAGKESVHSAYTQIVKQKQKEERKKMRERKLRLRPDKTSPLHRFKFGLFPLNQAVVHNESNST